MRLVLAALLMVAVTACNPLAPKRAGDPKLDPMFAALIAAPSAAAAAPIEAQIWQAWAETGSPTVDVLLDRATQAQAQNKTELARTYLDEATRLLPDHAEAYSRRAAIAFAEDDLNGALADLAATLDREPRHFGALMGVGAIYERLGRNEAALKAYQDALAVNPYLEGAKQGVTRLAPKVDGEDI